MVDCAHRRRGRNQVFLTAEYDEFGQLRQRPDLLPCGSGCGGCRVHLHDTRRRVHGPDHDLAVLRCAEHRRCFTALPLGWVPFAREPLVEAPTERVDGLAAAALEAARGHLWPESHGDPAAATQRRHIRRMAAFLALAEQLSASDVEVACLRLGLALSCHQQARTDYLLASDRRARGQAIECLCQQLDPDGGLLALLQVGWLCGACGRPFLADGNGVLVPMRWLGQGRS